MIKRIIYPVLCAAICFTSCKKTTENVDPVTGKSNTGTQNSGPGNNPTIGAANTNINNAAMLKMVNDVRATGCTCGTTVMPPVAPLTWNDLLAASALSHSNDMAATGKLDHNSSDGTSFSDRITAAGYVGRLLVKILPKGRQPSSRFLMTGCKARIIVKI